jgi:hypothetical protein
MRRCWDFDRVALVLVVATATAHVAYRHQETLAPTAKMLLRTATLGFQSLVDQRRPERVVRAAPKVSVSRSTIAKPSGRRELTGSANRATRVDRKQRARRLPSFVRRLTSVRWPSIRWIWIVPHSVRYTVQYPGPYTGPYTAPYGTAPRGDFRGNCY